MAGNECGYGGHCTASVLYTSCTVYCTLVMVEADVLQLWLLEASLPARESRQLESRDSGDITRETARELFPVSQTRNENGTEKKNQRKGKCISKKSFCW